jgi:hypothetical protein
LCNRGLDDSLVDRSRRGQLAHALFYASLDLNLDLVELTLLRERIGTPFDFGLHKVRKGWPLGPLPEDVGCDLFGEERIEVAV